MKKCIIFVLLSVLGVMNGAAADYPVATQEQLNSIVDAPAGVEFELLQPSTTNTDIRWTYNSSSKRIYHEFYVGNSKDNRLRLIIKTPGYYKLSVNGYKDIYSSSDFNILTDCDSYTVTSGSTFSVSTNCTSVACFWIQYSSFSNYISKIKIEKIGDIPSVTYSEEGKLGASVLKMSGIRELNDVRALKINGPIGEFDWKVIKEMSNLGYLDMTDAKAVNDELPGDIFSNRDNLYTVLLPSTLKTLSKSGFNSCSDLTMVTIPNLVTVIPQDAFYSCQNLYEVQGCENIEAIEENGFCYCRGLKNVWGCNNLKNVGRYGFYECNNLTNFTDMSSVKFISEYAFYHSYNLKTANLREATNIGECAFYECSGLENLNLKNAISIGRHAFYGCSSINSLSLPSLESIGNYAFKDCVSLETLVLSDKLTNLGTETFYNCNSLKSIVLPASIAKCDPSVFTECRNVTRVECNSPTPPNATIDNAPFAMDVMLKATLVVQNASMPSYKQHQYWKYFANWEASPTRITDLVLTSDMLLTNGVRLDKLNLTINSNGGSITINGPQLQELKKVVFKTDGTNFAQFLSNCDAVSSDNTYIEYSMKGGMWYYLTLPFDVDIAKLKTTNDALYAICRYDGETRAANGIGASWTRVYDGTLKAGTGYIIQCNTATTVTFTATDATINSAFNNDAIATTVNEFTSTRGTADAGWNFVGNPYMTYFDIYYMDFSAPITVWNGSTYVAYSVADDELTLKPMQPFFIQCPVGTSKITFNTAGRQLTSNIDHNTGSSSAKAMSNISKRKVYNLQISDMEGNKDVTRIVVNANMSDDYEMECDAAKMMSENDNIPQLWTSRNGINYAINEGKQQGGTVALSMYIPQDGTYTIATTRADDAIMLYDSLTKETSDISKGYYTFQAVEGELNARFTIYVAEDNTTHVGGTNAANDAFSKAAVFSLDGKSINKNHKGIVVKNRKKFVNK